MNKVQYSLKRNKQKLGIIYKYYSNYNFRLAAKYAKLYEETQIKEKHILFESRDGKSFTDSPLAMYLYLFYSEQYKDYSFYWSYTEDLEEQKELLPYDNRVKFVKRNSNEYLECLTSCQYVINNSTFQAFYTKKENQIYINTWHGTPLKKMGYDMPDEVFGSKNVMRNLLMSDYFLSPNEYTSNIFRRAYKLDGLYDGEILEHGYPRCDFTTSENVYEETITKLQKYLNLDLNKKIILYTPTWKGNNFQTPENNVEQILQEIKYLQNDLGNQYQILCKVHPFSYRQIKNSGLLDEFLIPDYFDANQILSITDILITDYSSIFMDFLVTRKPIIFYCWDKESYSENRGMYLNDTYLPGPVVSTIFEVKDIIDNLDFYTDKYKDKYEKLMNRMCSMQTGNVTSEIVDYIFQKKNSDIKICQLPKKEKLLIYGGALKANGITEALMSLIDNLDLSKYDITILTNSYIRHHGDEESVVLNNIKKLLTKVRVLFKFGEPCYTLEEHLQDKKAFEDTKNEINYPILAYKRESNRLNACCNFDIAIDYSGYSYYWGTMIAFANSSKHYIYQHNDLYEEQFKVVNGKQVHYQNLQGIFKLYSKFDKIVNVSQSICEVNSNKLSKYAEKSKFIYAHNILRVDKILNYQNSEHIFNNIKYNSIQNINIRFVSKTKELSYISSLESKDYKQMTIKGSLTGIMQCYFNGEYYIKFMYKGLIYGWCKLSDIVPSRDEIINEQELDLLVRVNQMQGFYYYNFPYNTGENCVMLGYMSKLWGAILKAKKEIVTSGGIFLQIFYGKEEIGWCRKEALTVLPQHNFKLLKDYATTRLKIDSRITSIQKINMVGTLKPGNHTLYRNPPGSYKAQVQGNIDSDKTYLITSKVVASNIISYYLKEDIDGNVVGSWIDQKSLANITEPSNIPIDNKTYMWKRSWFNVYQTPSLNTDDIQIMVNANELQEFDVLEQQGNAYKIKVRKNQIYYVDKSDLIENIVSDNQEFKLDSTKLNFVNVARLSPEKNQLNLVEAVNLLLTDHPEYREDFRLYIIGNGVLFNDLDRMITKYQLDDQIKLLGRLDQPSSIMKQCRALIFPSIYEGQGLVLLEALTLGLDIIASDIPTSQEVLENGRYGLLAKGTDANSLKDAIFNYLNNHYEFDHFDYKLYNQNAIDELMTILSMN